MAKFQFSTFLNSNKGQSAVEYLLLLGLVASLTFVVINNSKFKDFVKGDSGLFAGMRRGMSYSYRYGKDTSQSSDVDSAMSYNYGNPNHELYLNKAEGQSHFFMGTNVYGN